MEVTTIITISLSVALAAATFGIIYFYLQSLKEISNHLETIKEFRDYLQESMKLGEERIEHDKKQKESLEKVYNLHDQMVANLKRIIEIQEQELQDQDKTIYKLAKEIELKEDKIKTLEIDLETLGANALERMRQLEEEKEKHFPVSQDAVERGCPFDEPFGGWKPKE